MRVLHQILCKITAIQAAHRHQSPSRCPSCIPKRKDRPGRQVHGGHVDRLKPGLRHPLSVSLGGRGSFPGQNRTFFRRNTEFVVESVVQDFLHVQFVTIPCNGVHQLEAGRSCRGAAPVTITAGEFSHGGRPLETALEISIKGQPI